MKINQIQKIAEVYGATSKRQVKAQDVKAGAKDKLEISETARHFQTALKAAKASPEIRSEKVNQIKAQIDAGTYKVSAEDVAKKMMAEFGNHSL